MDATAMAHDDGARARTARVFEDVRRRVRVGAAFAVTAHGALGAAFGAALARMGEGGHWPMAALAAVAGMTSALWTAGRLPRVAAGRVIEQRCPGCRNVLVTADELLSGALDASDAAAARVFHRASALVARGEPARAAAIERRVAASCAAIAASAAAIAWMWRTTP